GVSGKIEDEHDPRVGLSTPSLAALGDRGESALQLPEALPLQEEHVFWRDTAELDHDPRDFSGVRLGEPQRWMFVATRVAAADDHGDTARLRARGAGAEQDQRPCADDDEGEEANHRFIFR